MELNANLINQGWIQHDLVGGVHWFEIMSVKYARGICCSFKAWFHDGEIFRVKLFAKYGWLHLSDSIEFRHFFLFRRE